VPGGIRFCHLIKMLVDDGGRPGSNWLPSSTIVSASAWVQKGALTKVRFVSKAATGPSPPNARIAPPLGKLNVRFGQKRTQIAILIFG